MTTAPVLVRADSVTGSGQVSSGASATGGGGGGVGALGVRVHPTQSSSVSSRKAVGTRIYPSPTTAASSRAGRILQSSTFASVNGAFTLLTTAAIEPDLTAQKKVIDRDHLGHYVLFVTVTKLRVTEFEPGDPALTRLLKACLAHLKAAVTKHGSGG